MSVARYQPAIGVLPDGTVLVAGGAPANSDRPYHRSAEIFDPSQDAWFDAGTMPVAGEIEAFATLGDGALLILQRPDDEESGLTVTLTGARYDPQTRAWEDVGGPTIRWDAHIELVGLHDGGALVLTNPGNVFRFTPGAGWDLAGKLLERRLSPAVVELDDGRILVAGGASGVSAMTSVELFDPQTGTSTEGRKMPVARIARRGRPAAGRLGAADGWRTAKPRVDGGTGSDRVVMRVVRWVP